MKGKVLYRLPRTVLDEDTGRNIRLNKLERYYLASDSISAKSFKLKKEDLKKNGFFSKDKDEFALFDSSFVDDYSRLKRRAQIITFKDIGPIIAHTGITRDSVVMDAGSGSGAIACFLAKIVKRVDSFDVKDAHIEVSVKNAKNLKIDNVSFEKKDVYTDSFKKEEYDVFTLDVPEPKKALKTAVDVLKVGGFLVVYAPHISQVQDTVVALPKNLISVKTLEVIEREWNVTEKTLRPATKDFSHTAFLCFIRKIA